MHLIIVELLHYDNGHKETLHQMTGSNKNSQTGFKEFLFLFYHHVIVYQLIFQISYSDQQYKLKQYVDITSFQ